jgi:hypothetical protein
MKEIMVEGCILVDITGGFDCELDLDICRQDLGLVQLFGDE